MLEILILRSSWIAYLSKERPGDWEPEGSLPLSAQSSGRCCDFELELLPVRVVFLVLLNFAVFVLTF